MVASKCFVRGCKTGSLGDVRRCKKENKRIPSKFSVPKDPVMLQRWIQAVGRFDKVMTPDKVVCELHFREDEVETCYETKMPDGSVEKMQKRKRLKKDAVPSIFSKMSIFPEPVVKCVNNLVDTAVVPTFDNTLNTNVTATMNANDLTWICNPNFNSPSNAPIPINPVLLKISFVPNLCTNLISSENPGLFLKDNSLTETILTLPTAETSTAQPSKCLTEGKESMADPNCDKSSQENETSTNHNVNEPMIILEEHEPEATVVIKESARNIQNNHSPIIVKVQEHTILPDPPAFTYDILLASLNEISKPDNWIIGVISSYILCTKWTDGCDLISRVVIDDQLNACVYLRNRRIADDTKLTSVGDFSSLLKRVDRYLMCAGIEDIKMVYCEGVLSEHRRNRKLEWCQSCTIDNRRKKEIKPPIDFAQGAKKWRDRAKKAERNSARLERKVNRLCDIVTNLGPAKGGKKREESSEEEGSDEINELSRVEKRGYRIIKLEKM